MATKNYNIRFRNGKADEDRAWEHLHSEEVRHSFRSQNGFVIAAINDFYDRHLCILKDPYLESREKEDAFADRIVRQVEEKFLDNLPRIVGQYFISERSMSEQMKIRTEKTVISGSNSLGKEGMNYGK